MYDQHHQVLSEFAANNMYRVIFHHILLLEEGWVIVYERVPKEGIPADWAKQERTAFIRMAGMIVAWDFGCDKRA